MVLPTQVSAIDAGRRHGGTGGDVPKRRREQLPSGQPLSDASCRRHRPAEGSGQVKESAPALSWSNVRSAQFLANYANVVARSLSLWDDAFVLKCSVTHEPEERSKAFENRATVSGFRPSPRNVARVAMRV